ncbi:hypothetical protein B0T11DRAFT_349051 [Plectosphaerella cucumerina]|uniref:Uncharacterized protein n=1 Tax=Plectosphaerella cucumerina TaxID=40658 RepID=A0A8K0TM44_9PEZI|nr:hypothetical protein B0T11DRAFT_349051 [Plectosphaerella cucumerina]
MDGDSDSGNSDITVRPDDASDVTVDENTANMAAENSWTQPSYHIEINTPTGIRRGSLHRAMRVPLWLIPVLEYVARFPSPIIQNIIQEALLFTGCAIRLLDPFFSRSGVTARMSTRMREEDLQRIEVYTRGAEGQRGKYSVLTHQIEQQAKFFPVPQDVEYWDKRSPGLSAMRALWPQEFAHARVEALESGMYYFSDTEFSFPGADFLGLSMGPGMTDILVRTNTVAGTVTSSSLPFTRPMRRSYETAVQRKIIQHRGGEFVTFYSNMRHLTLASTARYRPHGAMGYEERKEFEWARSVSQFERNRYFGVASVDQMLWLWLDWNSLSRLETLYMDLSALGDVIERMPWTWEHVLRFCNADLDHYFDAGEIRIKGMEVLNLSLLVIKGLKSFSLYVPTRDMNDLRNGCSNYRVPVNFSVEEVEDEDELSHLGLRFINWVKVFRHSLAEGGRLVFLDEQCRPEWQGWRYLNFGNSHDDDDSDDNGPYDDDGLGDEAPNNAPEDDAPRDDVPNDGPGDDASGNDTADRDAVDNVASDEDGSPTSGPRSGWLMPASREEPVQGFFQNGRFILPPAPESLFSSSSSSSSSSSGGSLASMLNYLERMEALQLQVEDVAEEEAAGSSNADDADETANSDGSDNATDAVATDFVNDLIDAAVASTVADGDDDDTVDEVEVSDAVQGPGVDNAVDAVATDFVNDLIDAAVASTVADGDAVDQADAGDAGHEAGEDDAAVAQQRLYGG